jgi:hypothetical protein
MWVLPLLLSEYHPNKIFNRGKCDLFLNLLPDKSNAFEGKSCHGCKRSKDRIALLLCTNMDESEKMPLLVIWKSEKPRCFKHMKPLPCTVKYLTIFPSSTVHFLWSWHNAHIKMYNYIRCIIPRSIVFLHESFRIVGLDPQYSQIDRFWDN